MLPSALRHTWGYTTVLAHALTHQQVLRDAAVRQALARQIAATGVQGLAYIVPLALLFGAVAVTRVIDFLGPDDDTALKTLIWGGLREIGPLIVALIMIMRSGVAIAAEVALITLRSGIRDTHWNALDDEDELVLPRVIGMALSGAALVSVFQFVAVATALVASAAMLGTNLEFEFVSFLSVAEWRQVPLSIGKGALFGAGIATISCWHGLQASQDMAEVPKAVASACVASFAFVLVIDVIAALTRLL